MKYSERISVIMGVYEISKIISVIRVAYEISKKYVIRVACVNSLERD